MNIHPIILGRVVICIFTYPSKGDNVKKFRTFRNLILQRDNVTRVQEEDIRAHAENTKDDTLDDAPGLYLEYCEDDARVTAEMYHLSEKARRENELHKKKLLELCENYTEDEAIVICKVFARKFPGIMHTSLCDEHQNMAAMISVINQSQIAYMDKMCSL